MSLAEKIDAEVNAVESGAKTEATRLFDKSYVNLREEVPGLLAKMGIDTSSDANVFHATLAVILDLLKTYGPAEIRDILAGA